MCCRQFFCNSDMKSLQINNDANYYEYVYAVSKVSNERIDINVPEPEFVRLMTKVKTEGFKYFAKNYKVFQHNTLIYKNNENNDVKLYNRLPVECSFLNEKIVACSYSMGKVPIHMFPCSLDINDVHYSNSLIFRIHNRIYLNFEKQSYPHLDNKVCRKIFVNYHHDQNVDIQYIADHINRIINLLSN